jgi:hypothetical protein
VEPFPGVEPGSASIPRTRGRRSEGRELAGLKSNERRLGCGCPCRQSNRAMEPPPSATLGYRTYKVRPVVGPQGRGVLGGIRTRNLQALDLAPLPVGLQAHGAATRCRPGSPALRGRGRSRARRRSWPSWLRTRNSGFRARRVCQIPPMAIKCGRRESNAQAASFELARYSGSLHSRMVRHLGLEPRPDTG